LAKHFLDLFIAYAVNDVHRPIPFINSVSP